MQKLLKFLYGFEFKEGAKGPNRDLDLTSIAADGFPLLSFQYQFKDKYFDAANLRLPHGVPSADEYLRFLGLEPIDIRFSLRDHSEGLPYKFVGDSNDRHLAWLAVRPQTVETSLALGITPE